MKGLILDLDGVITDTSHYHYLAWKKVARSIGFELTYEDNDKLKGVSRMASLEIILELGNIRGLSSLQKQILADTKNLYYLDSISEISNRNVLPGILDFIKKYKEKGWKIGLGSSSKSGRMIVEKLGITKLFDVIVDGNMLKNSKPDPEVFQKAAELMGIPYTNCIVVEDAQAGLEAAKSAGMACIGVGNDILSDWASLTVDDTTKLEYLDLERIMTLKYDK